MESAPLVPAFSGGQVGPTLPQGWQVVPITERKKPTRYDLVTDGGTVVLHAVADGAATALGVPTRFDIRAAPVIAWRWKINRLIAGADPRVGSREDSPVRIVLEFDGDKSKLGLVDRSQFALSKNVGGRELPFATLMYVWANQIPVGTVVQNPHTARVQMIVAASGEAGVGAWQSLSRNVLEDYKRAFGEEPGNLKAVGVLTDTDNTGESVEAWYGDIRFTGTR